MDDAIKNNTNTNQGLPPLPGNISGPVLPMVAVAEAGGKPIAVPVQTIPVKKKKRGVILAATVLILALLIGTPVFVANRLGYFRGDIRQRASENNPCWTPQPIPKDWNASSLSWNWNTQWGSTFSYVNAYVWTSAAKNGNAVSAAPVSAAGGYKTVKTSDFQPALAPSTTYYIHVNPNGYAPPGGDLTYDCMGNATRGWSFTTPPAVTPVNGGWTEWGTCSATACGTAGTQTRTCTNPAPANGGTNCTGEASKACTAAACVEVPQPSNQTATCNGVGDRVTINWNSPSGITKFALRFNYKSNDSSTCQDGWNCNDVNEKIINDLNTNTYVFGATPGANYQWWVHSIDGAGNYSDTVRHDVTCNTQNNEAALVCNKTCGNNAQCPSNDICFNGFCRNPQCTDQTDCNCPSATATVAPTTTIAVTARPTTIARVTATPRSGSITTATPTGAILPEAGLSLPGVAIFGGGLLMAIVGILLAI